MTLIQQIIDDAMDQSVSISQVLLRCKVLASRIGDTELENWVEAELNGYKADQELPSYRVIPCALKVNASNIAWQITGQAIPQYVLPREMWDDVSELKCRWSIIEIEAFDHDDGEIRFSVAERVNHWVSRNAVKNANVTSAYLSVSSSAVTGLIGAIRSKVLDSALRVERDYPEVTDQLIKSDPEVQQAISSSFAVSVFGDGVTINVAEQIAIAQDNRQIHVGNLESLHSYLREQGLSDDDLVSLDEALRDEDAVREISEGRGKLAEWASSASEKVSGKAGSVAYEVVKQVAVKAVTTYLGLS